MSNQPNQLLPLTQITSTASQTEVLDPEILKLTQEILAGQKYKQDEVEENHEDEKETNQKQLKNNDQLYNTLKANIVLELCLNLEDTSTVSNLSNKDQNTP